MTQIHLVLVCSILILLLGSSFCFNDRGAGAFTGGISRSERPATSRIQQMIKDVQPQILSHLANLPGANNAITEFTPISYKTQVVNGINYFVKVGARTPNKVVYYHLRIYKTFGGHLELEKVEGPKERNDSIGYF